MTERRPLVIIAGEAQELPSGDTLPGGGGGGTTAINDLGDAAGNGAVNLGAYSQTWTWADLGPDADPGTALAIELGGQIVLHLFNETGPTAALFAANNVYIGDISFTNNLTVMGGVITVGDSDVTTSITLLASGTVSIGGNGGVGISTASNLGLNAGTEMNVGASSTTPTVYVGASTTIALKMNESAFIELNTSGTFIAKNGQLSFFNVSLVGQPSNVASPVGGSVTNAEDTEARQAIADILNILINLGLMGS